MLGFLLYSQTFQHSFHFDDFIFIVNNPEIADLSNLKQIWEEGSAPTRFITYLSFAVNYHIHQFDVFGYHLTNITVHVINSLLVFMLAYLLCSTPRGRRDVVASRKFWLAGCVAALFVAHPIQTQAVTYICQRFASLATLFYLLTVCLYIQGRVSNRFRIVCFVAAVVSATVGMFTKQIVLTLPLMIVFVELCFFESFKWKGLKSLALYWKWILPVLGFVLIIPAVYSFDINTIIFREFESLSHRGEMLNSPRYFLTQSRVIWTYIRLLFVPINQNLLYDFPASYHFFELKTFVGFLGIGALIVTAWKLRVKNVWLTFGIGWFFIALLVESSIIPIRQVIFEHRCYLPFFGFALCVVAGSMKLIQRPRVLVVAVVSVLSVLSILTYQRNKVWANDITLWTDVLKKSPNMIRPYTHLATAYLKSGDIKRALEIYSQAIEVDPQRAESYNNRGNVYVVLRQYDLALADYQKALSLDDSLVKTHNNIGIIYNRKKQFKNALAYYDKAIALDNQNAGVYFNRANVYLQQNQLDQALLDYNQAIRHNPFHKKARYYRSQIHQVNRNFDMALHDIQEAQRLGLKVDQTYIQNLEQVIRESEAAQ